MGVSRIQPDLGDEVLVDLEKLAFQPEGYNMFVSAVGDLCHAGNIA